MKDCKGNELNVGDNVIYVHGKNADAYLETGAVTKIYTDKYGKEECSVDGVTHIKRRRVMKL